MKEGESTGASEFALFMAVSGDRWTLSAVPQIKPFVHNQGHD